MKNLLSKSMRSMALLTGTACVTAMLVAVPAKATFTVLDTFRGLETTLQMINRLSQYMSEVSKNKVIEEGIHIMSDRKDLVLPAAGALNKAIKDDKKNAGGGNAGDGSTKTADEIAPGQNDVKSATEFIKKTFFVEAGASDEDKEKVRHAREEYLFVLAKEIMVDSEEIQKSTEKDLASLKSASASAGGEIQEIELNTQTIKSLALATAANILLDIRLTELEAASSILTLDEQLPKEKKDDNGGAS